MQQIKFKAHFTLDPWQLDFLVTKGDKILCCGRQIGKSEVCGIDGGEWSANHKKKVVLMIAPTERQAYGLFSKTLDYLVRNYRRLICMGKDRPTKSRIKLKNGTVIWCLPVGLNGLGVRFLTIHRLYADEASQIPDAVWTAITPMLLTTGGDSIYLSTPFGMQGDFYYCFSNKDGAYESFTRFSKDSETVIKERKICDTWTEQQRKKAIIRLEQERARMTALEYGQEYLGKFLADLRQVFSETLLRACLILKRRTTITPNRHYVLGQDIADIGKDTSTWEILDATHRNNVEQVDNITEKKWRTPARVRKTITLNALYNFRQIGIDDGGLGSGDFGYLLKEATTKRKVLSLNNASKDLDAKGEKKKKLLKVEMYNNLVAMMEMGEIKLLDDEEIYNSLRSVQFEVKHGKAKYHGNNTHIAEGLMRAAWCAKQKRLNIYLY